MKKKLMAIQSIGCFFLLSLICSGCSKNLHVGDDFEARLESDYERLGLTKQGLDYPNQKILEVWRKNNSYSKTYISVQEGKNELLAKIEADPERTLVFTLDTICRECGKNTDLMRNEEDCVYFTPFFLPQGKA